MIQRLVRMTLRRFRAVGLASEGGFTMIMAVIALMIASVLAAAALSAARDDVQLVRNDLDQKKAYYAAQAGISDYAFHLNQDVNYWTYCTTVPTPTAVNQAGSTTNRRQVPGSTDESYSIELLPASGQSACSPASPITTMIESTGPAAGTFRIRSTGYSRGVQRSIVATFRRRSFVDFIYYTIYETLDPSAYTSASDRAAAATACNIYWRDGRQPPASGRNYCSQIFFATGDVINGPLHTEDQLAICGSPVFGRNSQDAIEVVAPAPGHSNEGNSGCTDNPTFKGTYQANANSVQPPPTDAQLKLLAQPSYQFIGQTHIALNGTNMTVINNGHTTTLPFPSNGVVYVSTSTCSTVYSPFNLTYSNTLGFPTFGGSGCGTITVDGNYTGSLTLASDNDIVIDGNITHSGNALLGLIAQNYVRVYHPCSGGTNQSGYLSNPTIDAAILALTGSFIVDNYDCGSQSQLGNLSVFGAIAQVFRGPVGLIGSTGYLKNYTYDDRLREQEPPHFLNPIQAAWRIQRETECARGSSICP
jgi:type II secretory pathway pseudopilin PulG